ncbi:hypothetical protein [uncultured Sphingomonas sp.]|uniref:hypothetical protein n=1 Tax=uncultured Sphingomonas sp. TaxID=158754 RepID=UPI003747830C
MELPSRTRPSPGFSHWLRTGRLPRAEGPDGLELKFNPWHDPADGRFTFAGTERTGGAASGKQDDASNRPRSRTNRDAAARTPRKRTAILANAPDDRSHPASAFIGGVAEGLYKVGEDTLTGTYAALTTNPLTTIQHVTGGLAQTIDNVVAAEDTPARVQLSRATTAIRHASPRELGRATGSVLGNTAVAIAPGATVSKVSTLRHLRTLRPRTIYKAPKITWVKENLGKDSIAKRYNDSATGAQSGQAPALTHTMPDGSTRYVKFDGIESDYVIDRKTKVVDAPHARAQLLKQSSVLNSTAF